MASKPVIDAFAARLAANWTATPIIAPNTTGKVPADGSSFLIMEFPFAREEQISLGAPGSRVFREHGAARIVLCIPVGVGINASNVPNQAAVDALRAVFRGQQFSGVNTLAPAPTIFNDNSDRGAYFEFSFAVSYYFDSLG